MTEDPPIWEQFPGELNEWFKRFRRYLLMPGKRSLLGTYNAERSEKGRKSATGCPDNWRNAFKRWNWEGRSQAWDNYNNQLAMEQWQERSAALREREWQMAQASFDKANEMLKFPIAQKKSINGLTVIEPAKWSFRDASAILIAASSLGRKACELDEDPMLKQQLSQTYSLLQRLLTLEDSATAATVKQMVTTHLDALLLHLGKPIPEILDVLQQAMEANSDRPQ